MRRKVIVRDFVFTLEFIDGNKVVSSIVPERRKEDCYITKETYKGGHNDGMFYYNVPPYRFLSGNNIEDIFSKITDDFKRSYERVRQIEKQISSDIEGLSQTEIDKYFAIAKIQETFETNFEYNHFGSEVSFPFMTMYKFVNDDVQKELMMYAKVNLNVDEYNTFVNIIENVW